MIRWIHDASGMFTADDASCRVTRRVDESDPDAEPWAVDELHGDDLGYTEVRRFDRLEDALDWGRLTYGQRRDVRSPA